MKTKAVCIILWFVVLVTAQAQRFGKALKETPGVVSYTFRNSFQKDVALTLDSVKRMGFTNIEFSNLFGRRAADIKAMLDERGMKCTSFGTNYDDLLGKTTQVAENAKALGASFVRVAWIPHDNTIPFTVEMAKKAADDFNKAGKQLKEQYHLTFCYHNHGYEFVDYEKGTLFDYLVANTNPDYVSFEMDILWVAHPGKDPVALLKKYGPRIKLMHVKDLRKGVKGDFSGATPVENDVALGTGQIDVAAVIKAAVKYSAIENYYIEDESKEVNVQVPVSFAFLKGL
ncbi:MAG: sugar phosphate isomerase [Azospira oryzae]|jgi:sugar phosphate isomerase/epimerase|nr:MAG: sugar phosphate isomerase [Azospira oryzae]